jgi:hypothetical protein
MKKQQTSLASIRVDFTQDETDNLDTLQRQLRDRLGMTFVSKASVIKFLVRNTKQLPDQMSVRQ